MSFQERPNGKNFPKKNTNLESHQAPKSSLLINSSFSIGNDEKSINKQVTNEVLKKVSQTIVSLHSSLVPKTQNIEIYRDLSEQQQKMLKLVQDSQLIHTILAGVLAIDSCLKYIHREQTYIISSLMKGVTICLGNYKKVEDQFLTANGGKISENFLKFYDSLKLIISDIHKIPAAKIKKNQLDKHNDFITKSQLNNELLNSLNRQENLLFSLLAQQNNSLRLKLNDLQKELNQSQKEKHELCKQVRNLDSEKKKRESQNNLTQTGSQSAKGIQEQIMIRQLREQMLEKNDIIMKMNDEFAVEIQKYQKIFKRLQDENKVLKKYNDLDTAYILEQLEYEVQMLRQQKRSNQNVINQIMSQMNTITWNRNQLDYSNQSYGKDFKSRYYSNRFNNAQINDPRMYQIKRNRCPSVSPNNKQQNIMNRYFSPNYDVRQKSRNIYKNLKGYERRQSNIKRDDSPRFGNIGQQKTYQNIKQRGSRVNLRKQTYGIQGVVGKRQFKQDVGQMRRSQSKLVGMKISGMSQRQQILDINKLKKQMRRSKYLNQEMTYM